MRIAASAAEVLDQYAKRQLAQRGIPHEALDNGLLSCEDSRALQRICDGLSAKKIDALARKWFRRLPHPFPASDRKAGFRYDLSILQAEFSLTQVLDRPAQGRVLFEEILRDNLDLGRPDQVQLIFDRRVTRRTPGSFRTRIITGATRFGTSLRRSPRPGPARSVACLPSRASRLHES